jgi:mRNA interferase YafQ
MPPVKTASSKRAGLPRAFTFMRAFEKDWHKLNASGRYDMRQLKQAMLLLIANDAPLGAEWLDHPLKGQWIDHRECHIGGDFLLIYQIAAAGKSEQVSFVRAGTHTELFD